MNPDTDPPPFDDDQRWELRLYVLGQSPKSVHAKTNLEQFCKDYLAGRYEIEVVDLAQSPSRARTDNIIAIPTLMRQIPQPLRRLVGDLSCTEKLHHELGLDRPS
jgi:circadian clock protein KaiB